MSNFFCFCGYSCDSIPYMSDLIIETYLVMRVGVRPALTSGSVLYSGSILIVNDCVHSWKCYCFSVIYIYDVCVSVRTPKHFCDELPSFFEIISKCRISFTKRTASTFTSGLPTTAISGTSFDGTTLGTAGKHLDRRHPG